MASYQNQSQHEKGLEKKKAPISKNKKYGFIISVAIYTIVTLAIVYRHEEKREIFLNLISNKSFLVGFIITVGFIVYTLALSDDDEETERIKTATKHGVIAFLIAIMAALDLEIAPFWLVWLTSYYLDISG